ncbi:MAG: hypothetical protein ACO3FE_03655 [Planctomycetaceae bacterium]|jgi:hypothetical protein
MPDTAGPAGFRWIATNKSLLLRFATLFSEACDLQIHLNQYLVIQFHQQCFDAQ